MVDMNLHNHTHDLILHFSIQFLLPVVIQVLKELLWGVNIGGMGTLITSLASVISYNIYLLSLEMMII